MTTQDSKAPDDGEFVESSNPFASQQRSRAIAVPATARVEEQRAIAEVQGALVVARANPRDEMAAMDRILIACQRVGLAEKAQYQYARGGQDITGASIRLAEAVAQNWGNIQFGIRELDQVDGVSTVQAYAWDVQTNTRREVTFQVKHERHTKKGTTRLTDPRDVYENVANLGARRVRACILAVIPGDVVEAAERECEKTLKAKADVSEAGIAKLVASFAEIGVTRKQLEARIQRRLEAIQPAHVIALRRVFMSIRDEMSTVADHFQEPVADAEPERKGVEGLAAAAAKKGPKPTGQAVDPQKPVDVAARNELADDCAKLAGQLGLSVPEIVAMAKSVAVEFAGWDKHEAAVLLRLLAAMRKLAKSREPAPEPTPKDREPGEEG